MENDDALAKAISVLSEAVRDLSEQVRALREQSARTVAPAAVHPVSPAAPAVAAALPAPAAVTSGPAPEATAAEAPETVAATVLALLERMFRCLLAPDDEAAFEAFSALMHSSCTNTPRLRKALRQREWASARDRVGEYLSEAGDATSFDIVRWQPLEPALGDDPVKAYLRSSRRSPVPVSLRFDPGNGGALRIATLGL